MEPTLKHTTLFPWHEAQGAKLADFGGWLMPIEYTGVVAEHTAVRERVGIFDVSHMGKLRIEGPGALDWLNSVVASDLNRVEDGKAQYSMLLNAAGGVIDDLIIYRFSPSVVWIVPNAGNATEVAAALQALAPSEVTVSNLHNEYGIIAVQGPKSPQAVQALGLPVDQEYMSVTWQEFEGQSLLLCRSGYTGETGFELVAPVGILQTLWDALLAVGAEPCGLAARDTLRLEMGYPLHGHEITAEISPVEAGLSWAIGWDKPEFQGADVVRKQKAEGAPRKRVALRALERGVPRADMQVLNGDAVVGVTTSGSFSPTLSVGIALALVEPSVKIGDTLALDVRGRRLAVEVVKPPFVQPSTKN